MTMPEALLAATLIAVALIALFGTE